MSSIDLGSGCHVRSVRRRGKGRRGGGGGREGGEEVGEDMHRRKRFRYTRDLGCTYIHGRRRYLVLLYKKQRHLVLLY